MAAEGPRRANIVFIKGFRIHFCVCMRIIYGRYEI